MRVVIALGGNALLRREQPMSESNPRKNVEVAARSLAEVARKHRIIVTHGNGPQVGLLALQSHALASVDPYSLDVLGAESEGMIGYLIEQALENLLGPGQSIATLLTQVEVDRLDPAFQDPSKPIGPVYSKETAANLAVTHRWSFAPDGDSYRRIVPSPLPRHILEIKVIELLVKQGVTVICAGGGGIPVIRRHDGTLLGVEAVIDKDRSGALLAEELHADAYLMLTDVDAVYSGWGTAEARAIRRASPEALRAFPFAAGSMAPKVEAACEFVTRTGGIAGIGALSDASALLEKTAGTLITRNAREVEWYDSPGRKL